ncbi:hypothetical protein [Bacillus thuringiensis]|uniref:hypothetical protein n=1 Tax=Bacillus thuringiensis TaxID=1428 RepID=UPI000BFD04A3|nr:hypothetical protein [Bacillus thuringiensis]PGT89946.1 hypothetical protein COD17_09355 [Bacillus thuringiensis]
MGERQRTGQSIKDFLKLGGRMRNTGILNVNIRKFAKSPIHLEVLNKYFTLLVDTNFLNGVAYDVIVHGKKRKEIVAKYPNIAESYVRNLVYRDAKRVFNEIGCDPYLAIKEGLMTEDDAKHVSNTLEKHILENGKRGDAGTYEDGYSQTPQSRGMLTDHVQIDFKTYAEIDADYIKTFRNDADFVAIAKRFQLLSKPYFDNFMRDVDKRLVGYFMFLLNTDDSKLTERQKVQKNQLRQVWWLHEN